MASPQKENGFTPVANELLEALARTELKGSGYALVFAIMRKTFGFHKKEDRISISQLQEMLHISRRAVIYNLQELEAKKIIFIKRERDGVKNRVNLIKLNKDYETWVVQNSAPQVEKNRTSAKLRKKVVQNQVKNLPSFAPTKETITKDITKEIAETSSALKVKKKRMNKYNEANPYEEPSYDYETGDKTEIKVQAKKYPNSKVVFALFGKHPANWKINKTQLQAAENLFLERGVDQIMVAIKFYRENKEDKFCPVIASPYDLDSKWAKLIAFKKKQ